MKPTVLFLLLICLCSCIPYSFSPKISDHKIKKSNRFKSGLPDDHSFIFEDPKDADEFFYFINAKFKTASQNEEERIPISIEGKQYFLSFYEAEKNTRTLNLVPLFIDASRESNGKDPLLEDMHTSRIGKWYILVTVFDFMGNDALASEYPKQRTIRKYLKNLKDQYLNTNNYMDAYFME